MRTKSIGGRIFWEEGFFDDCMFSVPEKYEKNSFLRDNASLITYHTLSVFENIPITLPSTEKILKGEYNEDIELIDYLKIRAFAYSLKIMSTAVAKNLFFAGKKDFCILHKFSSGHDLPEHERGVFRKDNVKFKGLSYRPPVGLFVKNIWEKEFQDIKKIEHPLERACVFFLWASRTQFFVDCNKRASLLMMNGILAANNCMPVIVPVHGSREFGRNITIFYETGNADRMAKFLKECARETSNKLLMRENNPECGMRI